jgi:hypothetical protein
MNDRDGARNQIKEEEVAGVAESARTRMFGDYLKLQANNGSPVTKKIQEIDEMPRPECDRFDFVLRTKTGRH